jgi:hypothetical protein
MGYWMPPVLPRCPSRRRRPQAAPELILNWMLAGLKDYQAGGLKLGKLGHFPYLPT